MYKIGEELSKLYKKPIKELTNILEEFNSYINTKHEDLNEECIRKFERIFFLYKTNPTKLNLRVHKLDRKYFMSVKKDLTEFFSNFTAKSKGKSFKVKEKKNFKWICNLYSKNK
ncbi:hypothetical protein TUBRATIS_14970 [Tubulinosema ratisbonensis]|uniref:Uncharacterized protein n=1 Tax=Tubulinosema ratisbonensis TaxID=291195 RepID=A0A437ALQ3_9MICR|nr:hypothetical protein TUBRATIS_14970 [Tubulinosema ratisbonensis]